MKATQTLLALAAVFGSATAGYNATVTDIASYTVTVPCSTGTGTGGFTATGNGTLYTKPTPTPSSTPTGPSTVVTAGASSLDARVFIGAVAAVAAIAFTL